MEKAAWRRHGWPPATPPRPPDGALNLFTIQYNMGFIPEADLVFRINGDFGLVREFVLGRLMICTVFSQFATSNHRPSTELLFGICKTAGHPPSGHYVNYLSREQNQFYCSVSGHGQMTLFLAFRLPNSISHQVNSFFLFQLTINNPSGH